MCCAFLAVSGMLYFLYGTYSYVVEMDQESTKVSSWTQKCVDFSGIFVFEIGQKRNELFQLFEGPGEVKQTIGVILHVYIS